MLGPGNIISGHRVQFALNSIHYEGFLVVLACLLFGFCEIERISGNASWIRDLGGKSVSQKNLLYFVSSGQQW